MAVKSLATVIAVLLMLGGANLYAANAYEADADPLDGAVVETALADDESDVVNEEPEYGGDRNSESICEEKTIDEEVNEEGLIDGGVTEEEVTEEELIEEEEVAEEEIIEEKEVKLEIKVAELNIRKGFVLDQNASYITIGDALLALHGAMGLVELTGEQRLAATLDGDELTVDHAKRILRYARGLSSVL